MTLVYFEGEHGPIVLDRSRIMGAERKRTPTNYPTAVLVDAPPYRVDVRNGFDDVQRRLMVEPAE